MTPCHCSLTLSSSMHHACNSFSFSPTSFKMLAPPSSKALNPLPQLFGHVAALCTAVPTLSRLPPFLMTLTLLPFFQPSTSSPSPLHDVHPCHPYRTDVPLTLQIQSWPLPASRCSFRQNHPWQASMVSNAVINASYVTVATRNLQSSVLSGNSF